MHARHRSPGNGYRSGSLGMGLSGSQISPEGPIRGYGFYNSEHRNFNRGFGRGNGQPKSFQPSPPMPRKSGDILMEAGRLAAEYLVSQGVYPPSVLFGNWQNGSLNKQPNDLQDFRSQESDSLALPPDTRATAHSRLRNSASDAGLGRKRYMDDYTSTGSRSYLQGRRKGGPYRYSSDMNREQDRSASWPDRSRNSPDMEADDGTNCGNRDNEHASDDAGNELQKPSEKFAPKNEEADVSEPELDNCNNQNKRHSNANSSDASENPMHAGEISENPEYHSNLNNITGELKDGSSNDEIDHQTVEGDSSIQHRSQEGDQLIKTSTDLLTLCKFSGVPTRTRSSLIAKGFKVGSILNTRGITSDIGCPKGAEALVEDDSSGPSLGNILPSEARASSSKRPDNINSKALAANSVEFVGDLGVAQRAEPDKCSRSQSIPSRALLHDEEKESDQGLMCFEKSSSVVKERGEKRAAEQADLREGTKRQREWISPVPFKEDECINFPSVSEQKASSQDMSLHSDVVMMNVDDQSLVNNSQNPLVLSESSVEYAEEKQLFPGSFKICDLNLMGASDMNDNNQCDRMLVFPVLSGAKKEIGPVDVDLSMSNSSKSEEYNTITSKGKEIEIIDLENDSTQEVSGSDNLERKQPPAYMSYSTHNGGDIPDVPDYNEGLMMAEFLGTFASLPNVPQGINVVDGINHVSQDVNPLQNEIGLHNVEGTLGDDQETLGDDDSIYMSLGEIPLSMPDI